MRAVVAILLSGLLLVACASVALGARGKPKRAITPVDQARAKAMLVRRTDLASGVTTRPAPKDEPDVYCAALDESDLTVTGHAQSPYFDFAVQGVRVRSISSGADVYSTLAQANASWRRGTSAAGQRCLQRQTARVLAPSGITATSFTRTSFPRVASKTVRFRLTASVTAPTGETVPLFYDLVFLQHSRAQVGIAFFSVLVPFSLRDEVALARVVADRQRRAMSRP
jgi:hypothetical protein